MLEGKVDMSDVQENPFAEMMKADEAAEQQAAGALPPAENVPTEVSNLEPTADSAVTTEEEPAVDISAEVPTVSATEESFEEDLPAVYSSNNDDDDEDVPPVVMTSADEDEEEELPTVVSAREATQDPAPTQEASSEQQMSDEEFAEFMRKAQEFYSNGGTSPEESTAPIIQPDVEESPVIQKAAEPEEDKDDEPFFAGNEMTDAEYIAYLTRSAKNFGKKD